MKKKGSFNFKYLTKEGFKSVVTNALMSLASIAVLMSCLVIIGCALALFFNIEALLDGVYSQNVVMVFINDSATEEQISALEKNILNIENVNSCEYVSSDEAFERVKRNMGNSVDVLDGEEDILPASYQVTMTDLKLYEETLSKLRVLENISNIRESGDLADKLTRVRDGVTNVSIAIIIILFVVSVFIIANTVRITMFSRRLEINIMKAVGATRWFIRWPFLVEGVILGFIAAVLSFISIYAVYFVALNASGSLSNAFLMFNSKMVAFWDLAGVLIVVFFGIGIMTGLFGSFISMNKYLKEHGSIIYNDNDSF